MPTILRTLPTTHPDAAALTPLSIPSDTELALLQNALVKNWWRADAGLDSTGWRCRKTDAKLVPARTAMPTVQKRAGIVRSIAVTNGGAGYTVAPAVVIDVPPAGGIQATAVATINAGAVTAITITDEGSGYLGAPNVTFTGGGGGAGAAATATYAAGSFYNGQETLKFGSGSANGELYDGGLNLFPTNADFSVVAVTRPGPNTDGGYIVGNGISPTTVGAGGYGLLVGAGTGFNSYLSRGSGVSLINAGDAPASPLTYPGGPALLIACFDDKGAAAGEGNLLVSPGGISLTNSGVASTVHVTNGELHVGAAGPTSAVLSGASVVEGGDIAELMVLTVPLHLAAYADLLAKIRTYMGGRYGIVTP